MRVTYALLLLTACGNSPSPAASSGERDPGPRAADTVSPHTDDDRADADVLPSASTHTAALDEQEALLESCLAHARAAVEARGFDELKAHLTDADAAERRISAPRLRAAGTAEPLLAAARDAIIAGRRAGTLSEARRHARRAQDKLDVLYALVEGDRFGMLGLLPDAGR